MSPKQRNALIISHETEADFVRSLFINSTPSVPARLIRLNKRATSINGNTDWNRNKHPELYCIEEENRRNRNGPLHILPKCMIERNEILFKKRKKIEESIIKDPDRNLDKNDRVLSENTVHAKIKFSDSKNQLNVLTAVKSRTNITLASANADNVESPKFTNKSPFTSQFGRGLRRH
jgi:hypothetical protein